MNLPNVSTAVLSLAILAGACDERTVGRDPDNFDPQIDYSQADAQSDARTVDAQRDQFHDAADAAIEAGASDAALDFKLPDDAAMDVAVDAALPQVDFTECERRFGGTWIPMLEGTQEITYERPIPPYTEPEPSVVSGFDVPALLALRDLATENAPLEVCFIQGNPTGELNIVGRCDEAFENEHYTQDTRAFEFTCTTTEALPLAPPLTYERTGIHGLERQYDVVSVGVYMDDDRMPTDERYVHYSTRAQFTNDGGEIVERGINFHQHRNIDNDGPNPYDGTPISVIFAVRNPE